MEHRLPHSSEAASRARHLAERAADQIITLPRVQDFVLMVCEAVTNAVRHAPPRADGSIGLGLESPNGVIRGVVIDGGSGFTRNGHFGLHPSRDGNGHFGLHIIDALSDRWGTGHGGATHWVWFELDVSPPDSG